MNAVGELRPSNGTLTIWTVADRKYEGFIPWFLWSIARSNPGAKVCIGVEDQAALYAELSDAFQYLSERFGGFFSFRDLNFGSVSPNSLRFLSVPPLDTEYVYFSDIDFFYLEDVLGQHLPQMSQTGLPFNNVVRPGTKRLTGLHFSTTAALWDSVLVESLGPDLLQRLPDEELLYLLVEQSIDIDLSSVILTSRPLPGAHISLYSRYPFSTVTPDSGKDWVGWHLTDDSGQYSPAPPVSRAKARELLELLDSEDVRHFLPLLPDASQIIAKLAEVWCRACLLREPATLPIEQIPALSGSRVLFSRVVKKLETANSDRHQFQRAEARVGELESRLREEAERLENHSRLNRVEREKRRQDGQLLQMLVRRKSVKLGLTLAGSIERLRGRKDETPLRRLKEIVSRLTQSHDVASAEAPRDAAWASPPLRAKQTSNQAFEPLEAVGRPASKSHGAQVEQALSLMCRGEWVAALGVWDGLLGVLVGERLQVPRAGRVVCGWLTDPVGFKAELAEAQRLGAGSGVVTDTVVCSSVVGGHDVSWPAGGVVSGASYVRFTDDPALETWGVWSNRPLEFHGGTAVRSARWVKTHPHMLFPDARWVVWVDGNVIPLAGLDGLLDEFKLSGAPLGAISHPTRSTVTEEIVECVKRGKDSAEVLYAVEERMGVDPGVGLWETNVLFFDLQHPQLLPLLNRWWSLIEGGSHRDQVSLPYAVSSTGANIHPILPEGQSTRSDGRFALIPHDEEGMRTAGRELLRFQDTPSRRTNQNRGARNCS